MKDYSGFRAGVLAVEIFFAKKERAEHATKRNEKSRRRVTDLTLEINAMQKALNKKHEVMIAAWHQRADELRQEQTANDEQTHSRSRVQRMRRTSAHDRQREFRSRSGDSARCGISITSCRTPKRTTKRG